MVPLDAPQVEDQEKWRGKFSWPPVLVITAFHVLAFAALFFFSWSNFLAFLISHLLVGGIGATIGLHRYFSHRSFSCPRWLESIIGFLATLNVQQGPITWAMYHRAHHRFSDNVGDPHSSARGFWWSHIQWMFYICPNGFRKNTVSVKDLTSHPFLVFLDRYHIQINVAVPLLFYAVTRDVGMTLWAFPLRTVFFWHSTWLVNSYGHRARFDGKPPGIVRNSLLLTALVYGDGWHLNHHQHPALPRAGLLWNQPDPAYWLLSVLKYLKLIKYTRY